MAKSFIQYAIRVVNRFDNNIHARSSSPARFNVCTVNRSISGGSSGEFGGIGAKGMDETKDDGNDGKQVDRIK